MLPEGLVYPPRARDLGTGSCGRQEKIQPDTLDSLVSLGRALAAGGRVSLAFRKDDFTGVCLGEE